MFKILLVEDEPPIMRMVKSAIESADCDFCVTKSCMNGKSAVEALKDEHFDIVITDIKMPIMDGLQVARHIYENYAAMQVIILTAYADFSYAQKAIDYGVFGYVVKTDILETLPETIGKAIQKLGAEESKEKEDTYEDIFGRLQKYIEKNYMKRITLSDISQEIHANGNYLSRLYKRKTGQNLFDSINRMRLNRAKAYIAKGYRIVEAAEAVGFEDISYFSRVFRKLEGCSPREYEREIRGRAAKEKEEEDDKKE